jgi:hypothetical protein
MLLVMTENNYIEETAKLASDNIYINKWIKYFVMGDQS